MAGLAETCLHVGALLHWIEAATQIQDSTSCTSKENQWIMPKSMKAVSFLQLSEIDFSAPKRQKLSSTTNENPTSSPSCKITPPSEYQIQRFFHELSKDKCISIVLSVTELFSKEFVCHKADQNQECGIDTRLVKSQLLDLDRFFTLIPTNHHYPFLKLFVVQKVINSVHKPLVGVVSTRRMPLKYTKFRWLFNVSLSGFFVSAENLF